MKIFKIKKFTSSYDSEVGLLSDIILKINEVIRKVNMLIGEQDDKKG